MISINRYWKLCLTWKYRLYTPLCFLLSLKPGAPATYLYGGHLIRTTAVQAILEASPSYVQFETQNSIYTISYDLLPAEGQIAA